MDRLFLDANVLFSAAYRPEAGVARLWDLPDATLLSSDYAIEEARRNLTQPEQLERLSALLRTVQLAPTVTLDEATRGGVELREKDWPIVGGALAASATHLITGDKRDFGRYFGSDVLGIRVLPPAEYLRSRTGRSAP